MNLFIFFRATSGGMPETNELHDLLICMLKSQAVE